MAWQWMGLVLLAAAALAWTSLLLHRRGHRAAKYVDVAALALLFGLVNLVPAESQWLLGLLMFAGCFHLGVLMGWLPVRRAGG